jgi:catechol 2,3-dioxygenase-like lactoylglutathione lyase family enzyme
MGQKLRKGDPWMPGFRYSSLLPSFSLNLLVADVERSVKFYQAVLDAEVHYYDVDFGAMRVGAAEVMLHADHTHDTHPWHPALKEGQGRGLGLQLRLLDIDPDETEGRARDFGAEVIAAATDKAGHAWRETLVRDPDGYEWAVGVLIPPAKGPARPTE